MVSLRKLFLIPTALVLVAGVALAADPVINCPLTATSTNVLRAEGRTELLPTIAFSCTATGAGPAVPFTIQVFATGTTQFTSSQPGATVTTSPTIMIAGASMPVGTTVTVTPSVITFSNVLLTPAAPFTMEIGNLYVDGSSIPQGSSVGVNLIAISSNTVAADSKIFGATPFSPFQFVPNLGITATSLSLKNVIAGSATATTFKVLACQKDDAYDPTTGLAPSTLFDTVTFKPLLNTAFTPTFDPAHAAIPGAVPTRITLTVANVPTGVTLWVPLQIMGGAALIPGTTPVADLLAGYSATTLAGGFLANVTADPAAKYAMVMGGTVVYQVTDQGNGTTALDVPIYATANGPVLGGTVAISAGYAPVGTTLIPRFVPGGQIATGLMTVNACNTTLLFPYVIATPSYDTGIAISSSGVLGDTTNSASGTCQIAFFGKDAPTTAKTLDVTVATTSAFDIKGSMPTANFFGYAVATCNFVNASGYAFVANTTGGTASYLPMSN